MAQDDHWMDDRGKDSAFNRRKADLRMSRTRIPAVNNPSQSGIGHGLIDRMLGNNPGHLDSSPNHFAIPAPGQTASTASSPSWPPVGAVSSVANHAQYGSAGTASVVDPARSSDANRPVLSLEQQLDTVAFNDKQTGVYNFRHMSRLLTYEVERARVLNHTVSIVVLSIDKFQAMGIEYGTIALDKVLEAVTAVLVNAFRTIDLVGRLSENRFIIICPEMGREELLSRAETVCAACGLFKVQHQWNTFKFTVSIGLTMSSEAICDADSLLALADLAADDVTESGGNGVCYEDGCLI